MQWPLLCSLCSLLCSLRQSVVCCEVAPVGRVELFLQKPLHFCPESTSTDRVLTQTHRNIGGQTHAHIRQTERNTFDRHTDIQPHGHTEFQTRTQPDTVSYVATATGNWLACLKPSETLSVAEQFRESIFWQPNVNWVLIKLTTETQTPNISWTDHINAFSKATAASA